MGDVDDAGDAEDQRQARRPRRTGSTRRRARSAPGTEGLQGSWNRMQERCGITLIARRAARASSAPLQWTALAPETDHGEADPAVEARARRARQMTHQTTSPAINSSRLPGAASSLPRRTAARSAPSTYLKSDIVPLPPLTRDLAHIGAHRRLMIDGAVFERPERALELEPAERRDQLLGVGRARLGDAGGERFHRVIADDRAEPRIVVPALLVGGEECLVTRACRSRPTDSR